MWLSSSVLIIALAFASSANAQDAKKSPCEGETAPLMTLRTSWDEMHRAALALRPSCFDGYFAEGISDTVVRKVAKDWPGFLELLAKHPQDNVFFRLVLRSLNATLDPDDIRAVDRLALRSCPEAHKTRCAAMAKQAAAALADFDPPEPRDGKKK
jgi:hypothetical protein